MRASHGKARQGKTTRSKLKTQTERSAAILAADAEDNRQKCHKGQYDACGVRDAKVSPKAKMHMAGQMGKIHNCKSFGSPQPECFGFEVLCFGLP